jgi:hypothetical protein
MAPLEEPSTGEMVRTLMAQSTALAASLARIESLLTQYVTQEQRQADKELAAALETRQNEKIDELKARATHISRTLWTAFLAPLAVGLMIWLLTRGGA